MSAGAPAPGPLRRIAARRRARVGAAVLAAIALACLAGPALSPHGFAETDAGPPDAGPSLAHPFGTAELGEDLLTRCLVAGRASLAIGLGTAALATVAGAVLGLLAGGGPGWLDSALARLTDLVLAVPAFLLLVVLSVSVSGLGVPELVLLLAALSWPPLFRLVRARVLATRDRPYVEAARLAGAGRLAIARRHLLPAAAPEIAAFAGLAMALAILAETSLSFLALGLDPELAPSWGTLMTGGRDTIASRPGLTLFPGALVVLSVLAAGLLGDAVRDALAPAGRPSGAMRRWAP